MSEPAEWEAFYVMAGGAAAVLTGLIFVAVTLHAGSVLDNVVRRDRAWASVAILASQLFIAMAMLVPAQPIRLIGLEIDLIALFWVIRTVRVTKEIGPAMTREDRPQVRWPIEWVVWILWVVALVAAGVALTAENGAIGFPVLALAMVGMFAFAIWSPWVLLSEGTDR
jgi:hypothetical protein